MRRSGKLYVLCLCLAFIVAGCASTQKVRTAQILHDPAEDLACTPIMVASPVNPLDILSLHSGQGGDGSQGGIGSAKMNAGSGVGAQGAAGSFQPLATVYFAFDSAVLSSNARTTLTYLFHKLNGDKDKLRLEGFCDEIGSAEYNIALGERRAKSVSSYLKTLGFPEDNLSEISYGSHFPKNVQHTEEAWAENRRVEVVVEGSPEPKSDVRYGTIKAEQ